MRMFIFDSACPLADGQNFSLGEAEASQQPLHWMDPVTATPETPESGLQSLVCSHVITVLSARVFTA